MRILMVCRVDLAANTGIAAKIQGQRQALQGLQHQVDLLQVFNRQIKLNDQTLSPQINASGLARIRFYHRTFCQHLSSITAESDYDLIYFRFHLLHQTFVDALRQISRKSKIVIEYPTFPFETEFRSLSQRFRLMLHRQQVGRFRRIPLVQVHFGDDMTIMGRPSIPLANGFDVRGVNLRKALDPNDKIHLLAIGTWQFWHGIDRIIEMVANDAKRLFQLTLIGDNDHIRANFPQFGNECIQIVNATYGADLDPYFDRADLAVGVLGLHRKSMRQCSALKHREYCARGIPFFFAGDDPDFSKDLPFVLKVEASDHPIRSKTIIDFHQHAVASSPESIRQYAIRHLSWTPRMERVLHALD